MAIEIRDVYVPAPKNDLVSFTFVWRFKEDGDFYEQEYPQFSSMESAYKAWRKAWGSRAEDCVVFKVEMKR